MDPILFDRLRLDNAVDFIELLNSVDGSHFAHAGPEAVQRFLAAPEDVHLIGRSGEEAVVFGLLRGWHEGYATPSLGIAVRTGAEGHGYGRAMMQALEQIARDRGARQIRLRVHPENPQARRLYMSRGFVEAGMERGEILMLLDLASRGAAALDADVSGHNVGRSVGDG